MNASLAMGYIDDELAQLNTSYVDLLLFHHRCRTPEETASVWAAFEAAKASGKAHHIGVSNFNTHDLATLAHTAKEPIEVLEASQSHIIMSLPLFKMAAISIWGGKTRLESRMKKFRPPFHLL